MYSAYKNKCILHSTQICYKLTGFQSIFQEPETFSLSLSVSVSSLSHFISDNVRVDIYQLGLIVLGEGDGTPLQYSCLENPMDGGAWKAAVRGVAEGRARLSDFTFTFHFHALEKEMASHSSVLAWRIPGTGEPGGLPSMGSHRVGHD